MVAAESLWSERALRLIQTTEKPTKIEIFQIQCILRTIPRPASPLRFTRPVWTSLNESLLLTRLGDSFAGSSFVFSLREFLPFFGIKNRYATKDEKFAGNKKIEIAAAPPKRSATFRMEVCVWPIRQQISRHRFSTSRLQCDQNWRNFATLAKD